MNHLSYKHSFYTRLLNLKPLYRYLISFTAVFIFTNIWFFKFYQKLNNEKHLIYCDILQLKQKEIQLIKIKNKIKELELNIDFLKEEVKQKLNEANSNFNIISENCDSNLLLLFCNSSEKINKKLYSTNLINFNLKGNFNNFFEFLKKISRENNIMKCKKLHINRINDLEIYIECIYKFYHLNSGNKCLDFYCSSF